MKSLFRIAFSIITIPFIAIGFLGWVIFAALRVGKEEAELFIDWL